MAGAGPGDPGLLTLRGARAVRDAGVLLHDPQVGQATLELAPPGCERIDAGKIAQDEIERLIVERARAGRCVVRLFHGDPSALERSAREAIALRAAGIAFEIVPGVAAGAPATDGPLFGKRVLVTRAAAQSREFARELYARGVEPLMAATIAIGPPDDPHAAARAIDDLAQFSWVVFSSQNAVDAFFDRLASLDADARYLARTRVAAIGAKTAERLNANGVRADLIPAKFVGEEIARALIEAADPGARVLIFRAQEARDVLPLMLEDAGLHVTTVAAYKTIFARDAELPEKLARADAITFTSASTVRGFVSVLGGEAKAIEAARGKAVACIGPVTADAARECGFHVDVVADVFTTGGLLDALEAHFALRG